MHAELRVLSPLVPVRTLKFLRFCKQHADGLWAVVDVSIGEGSNSNSFFGCRRLPSGCVVQDMPNGFSKVIIANIQISFISNLLYVKILCIWEIEFPATTAKHDLFINIIHQNRLTMGCFLRNNKVFNLGICTLL